jgi:DNA-directed RNA polymerase specialized sigma24 family protein
MRPTHWTDAKDLERYLGDLLMLDRLNRRSTLPGKLDPSDLVQTALLQAYDKRGQFRGESETEFLAWLRTILANQLAKATRRFARQKRDAALERSHSKSVGASESRITAWLAAEGSSPSQRLRILGASGPPQPDMRAARLVWRSRPTAGGSYPPAMTAPSACGT